MSALRVLGCVALALAASACTRDLELGLLLAHDAGAGGSAASTSSSSTTSTTSTSGGGGGGGGVVVLLGCTPGPGGVAAVARGASGPLIAHDGAYAYWIQQGLVGEDGTPSALYLVPLSCAGEVRSFALGIVQVAGIALDATNLYLTVNDPPQLLAMPLGGATPPAPMLAGTSPFGEVAAAGGAVYWATPADGSILTTPVGGTTATTFVSGEATPTSLVVEPSAQGRLLWIDAATSEIRAGVLASGTTTTLATAHGHAVSLARGSPGAYWIEQSTTASSHDGRVIFLPIGSPEIGPAVRIAEGLDGPDRLVVDLENVYWTDSIDGTVLRAPATPGDGGAPFVVAPGQSSPTGIMLDSPYLYWVDSGTQTLYRAPN